MAWFPHSIVTKMKPSFVRASISSLFIGERAIVSVKPKLTFSDFNGHCYRSVSHLRTLVNPELLGNGCMKQSFHSSFDEDDAFSELGLPVSQGISTVLKLMTEKPDHLKKTDPARKVSSGKSLPAESTSVKEIHLKQSKPVRALPTMLEEVSGVSRLNTNSNNAFNCKRSSSVTIEKVPSVINLHQLKEAVSIFGEVSNASMRTVPNELDCCDIKFESIESSRKAVSAGKITVGSFCLPVLPLSVPMTITIRISNIGMETADTAIHSVCTSYGPLEGLAKTKEDEVDAFFSLKNNLETLSLLKKLNHTIIDNCQWSADITPSNSSPEVMVKNEDAKSKFREQINSCLAELKRHNKIQRLYVEDLENLHLERPLFCSPFFSVMQRYSRRRSLKIK